MDTRHLKEIFNAALAAVDPSQAVKQALHFDKTRMHAGGATYSIEGFNRIVVIGAGKAAPGMARAIEELLGGRIDEGIIIVKEGQGAPLRIIEQVEASHPAPNEAGVRGTRRILDLARAAAEDSLVFCLLSGGASALLTAPADGLTLQDKQDATRLLLDAGANIGELNTVRKHLSAVKGGRLAEAAAPSMLVSLILSDVVGDRLDVIASGPTAPDDTTFKDALAVLEKYHLRSRLPERLIAYLARGAAGQEADTVKSDDPCFQKTKNVIIGGISEALSAAKDTARRLGYTTEVVTAELQGEARDAAKTLAKAAMRARGGLKPGERRCLLAGGETTVTVRGRGKGGRNQELALAFALAISGADGIDMLSAGTDGTDGPTDAAGAVVDGGTVTRARGRGLEPEPYLANNDSYAFFQQFDALTGEQAHLKTGPTGTNVMDMQIILIEKAG